MTPLFDSGSYLTVNKSGVQKLPGKIPTAGAAVSKDKFNVNMSHKTSWQNGCGKGCVTECSLFS